MGWRRLECPESEFEPHRPARARPRQAALSSFLTAPCANPPPHCRQVAAWPTHGWLGSFECAQGPGRGQAAAHQKPMQSRGKLQKGVSAAKRHFREVSKRPPDRLNRPPEPCAQVRILPRALLSPLMSAHIRTGGAAVSAGESVRSPSVLDPSAGGLRRSIEPVQSGRDPARLLPGAVRVAQPGSQGAGPIAA
jgi:hypothetical protein